MATALRQIAAKAKQDPKPRFTSLAHVLMPECLRDTGRQLNRQGASGIDGETLAECEPHRAERLHALGRRRSAGQDQAPPVRRVASPKGNGTTRPLGRPPVADRLLQRAVARILRAIADPECLECSFGDRPGRNPPWALQARRNHLVTGQGRQVDAADIQGYCTPLHQEGRRRRISLRIADPVSTGLIGNWLQAGVMEQGVGPGRTPAPRKGARVRRAWPLPISTMSSPCGLRSGHSKIGKAKPSCRGVWPIAWWRSRTNGPPSGSTAPSKSVGSGWDAGWPQTRRGGYASGALPASGRPRMAGSPALSSCWGANTSAGSTPRASLRSAAFRQSTAAGNSARAQPTGSSATATGADAIRSGTSRRRAKESPNALRSTDACPSWNASSPLGKSRGGTPSNGSASGITATGALCAAERGLYSHTRKSCLRVSHVEAAASVSWEARCGKSARRVFPGGTGTRATKARLYRPQGQLRHRDEPGAPEGQGQTAPESNPTLSERRGSCRRGW
jgi:hypothetical protein